MLQGIFSFIGGIGLILILASIFGPFDSVGFGIIFLIVAFVGGYFADPYRKFFD